MLKESDYLDILGLTFDSKKIFENHHFSVSKGGSQKFGIFTIVLARYFQMRIFNE